MEFADQVRQAFQPDRITGASPHCCAHLIDDLKERYCPFWVWPVWHAEGSCGRRCAAPTAWPWPCAVAASCSPPSSTEPTTARLADSRDALSSALSVAAHPPVRATIPPRSAPRARLSDPSSCPRTPSHWTPPEPSSAVRAPRSRAPVATCCTSPGTATPGTPSPPACC